RRSPTPIRVSSSSTIGLRSPSYASGILHCRSAVREWGRDRSGGGISVDLRLEHLEHGGPVAIELLQPAPADLTQTIDRTRLCLDDAVQRGIGEDDIGGHTLLLGLLGPPGPQGLEQGGLGG